jgi:hypothetical protein
MDGRFIVSGARDYGSLNSEIIIWDAQKGALLMDKSVKGVIIDRYGTQNF